MDGQVVVMALVQVVGIDEDFRTASSPLVVVVPKMCSPK